MLYNMRNKNMKELWKADVMLNSEWQLQNADPCSGWIYRTYVIKHIWYFAISTLYDTEACIN